MMHEHPIGKKNTHFLNPMLCIVVIAVLSIFFDPTIGKASSADSLFIDTLMPSSISFEIIADWKAQDSVTAASDYSSVISGIKSKLPTRYASQVETGSTEALYLRACHWRRVARIVPLSETMKHLLYARHYNEGGSIVGYLEDINSSSGISLAKASVADLLVQSKGDQYAKGSALLSLHFNNCYPSPLTILEDPTGVLRDPCVSFDGNKIAFAWSKDNNGYHIFEMPIGQPNSIRQLTKDPDGLTVSDFEPCYLPNGNIMFVSSRCFGIVPCNLNRTSTIFIMDKDGNYVRRICFDQVNNFSPTMKSDGTVLYSRWEFNDRNCFTVLGIFNMNPDGTHQTEYFGNQLSWPNTFPQAREIPESRGKFLSIIGSHTGHVYQGDLAIVDFGQGRNEKSAIQLIAPKRANPVNSGSDIPNPSRKFQTPYPLNETWFLISYRQNTNTELFRLYLMDVDGNRELLAWDSLQSVCQPVSLFPRKPYILKNKADYTKTTGTVMLQNAYYGMEMDSTVKAGAIKKIRVIAIEHRPDIWLGYTGAIGYTNCPIARYGGSWESKRILGEARVESDGSAAFIVPVRTPIFFQLIDSNGCMIQSMRSWVTLTPGENVSCFGCHENKNVLVDPKNTIASTPQELDSLCGIKNDYLYYPKYIQPLLNEKCVSCHVAGHSSGLNLSDEKIWTGDLSSDPDNKNADRFWRRSYLSLTDTSKHLVNYITINSFAEGLKPNTVGSGKSALVERLRAPAGAMEDVKLTKNEMGKICAWIDLCIPHGGKYSDDMKSLDSAKFENSLKRRTAYDSLEAKNINDFIRDGQSSIMDEKEKNTKSVISIPVNNTFKARFSPVVRQLFVKLPSEGNIMIVDLRGRRILSVKISREEFLASAEQSFPLSIPAGLYIIKFRGSSSSGESIIPVL